MAVCTERKLVAEMQETLDLDTTVLALRSQLDIALDLYGRDAYIEKYSYPYEDTERYAIFMKVPETDEQMAKRIAQELMWEATRLQREKQEFERLNKLYGGKS